MLLYAYKTKNVQYLLQKSLKNVKRLPNTDSVANERHTIG